MKSNYIIDVEVNEKKLLCKRGVHTYNKNQNDTIMQPRPRIDYLVKSLFLNNGNLKPYIPEWQEMLLNDGNYVNISIPIMADYLLIKANC